MVAHHEDNFAYYRIQDAIVSVIIKQGIIVTPESILAITSRRLHLQKNRGYPILFDMTNIYNLDKAARDCLGQFGWVAGTKAVLLAPTKPSFLLAQFLIVIHKPPIPTQVFEDRNTSLTFLTNT